MRGVWIVVAVSLAACYKPSFKDCAIGCETATGCPSGLTCDMDSHMCTSAGTCTGGGDANRDSRPGDGNSDAPPPLCAWSYTPSNFNPCDPSFPAAAGPLMVAAGAGTQTIDTATCASYAFNNATVCVKHYTSIDIAGAVRVVGRLPLILVSDADISVTGTIIDNATIDLTLAPGCQQVTAAGNGSQTAGGAGAGHLLPGGDGGHGNITATTPGAPMYGANGIVPLELGCPGGTGGDVAGGTGGNGGGAVQLSAKGTLTVGGLITVNGDGGLGGGFSGSVFYGGGGGGAAGSVFLEGRSVTVTSTASVCAVGGGGGQGGTTSNIGASGQMASTCQQPPGGGSSGVAGSGGIGGADSRPGNGVQFGSSRGGGGGGGAGGRIRVHASNTPNLDQNETIVPAPVVF
jgi:hypothetical protein